MALENYRIYQIVDSAANICNKQICVEPDVDLDLGYRMHCGRDNTGGGPKTGVITKWLAKDRPARVTSLNISGLTAVASLIKTDGAGNLSAGQISIATLNSFLSDGPIPTCPVITAGQVVYGGGSAGTPITSKNSFFFDSANNYLGIGHATPNCGLHVGANNPTYSSSASDAFITGDLEVTNLDLINTIRAHNFTPGSIPYFSGAYPSISEANSNLYYTDTSFGAKLTPTDQDTQIDIAATPGISSTGGHAIINITATAQGTSKNGNVNISTTPGIAGNGDITLDSADDIFINATQVVHLTSGTNKAGVKLYPTSNGEIRFESAWIYANWTNQYLPFSESSAEESAYTTNFGEVSILNAMNQLYSAGGVSEPAGQIVYGTGSGVDSEANFHWDATNDELTITNNVNKTNWYDADAAAIKLTGTATQEQVIFSDQSLILGISHSSNKELNIFNRATSNGFPVTKIYTYGAGGEGDCPTTKIGADGDTQSYIEFNAKDTTVSNYITTKVNASLNRDAYIDFTWSVSGTGKRYLDLNQAELRDIKNASWGAPTTASFSSNTITANFSTGKDIQEVSLTANATTLTLTAPSGGAAKGLQIICYASGADRDVGGGSGFNGVNWSEDQDLATSAKTIPSGKYGIITLTYDDSNWFGSITVFA